MSTVTLPTSKDVKDMLTGLVGRPVSVLPGDPLTPTPAEPVAVAVFVDPVRQVNALCVMDAGAAVYSAGALALLPPGGCQDSVEDRELTRVQFEALHEVMNVLSALLNVPGAPHSKFDGLHWGDEEIPSDIAGMLSSWNRIDLNIDIAGYGKGRMALVIP